MLARTAVVALNHLLAGEAWARERLRPFAGRHLRLVAGPVELELTLDGQGLFQQPDGTGAPAAVTIELPADALFRLPFDRAAVFAAARLSGTADMTEALAFVFRNLRWDVEEDLAKVFGDIVARRLVLSGRMFMNWQRESARNLAVNAAEFLGEEAALLLPRRQLEAFRDGTQALGNDIARLEQRLATLA